MATDFKYVPLDPESISGKAVLEQTQIAINELGGEIEEGVNNAKEIAQQALNTANSANATANEALTEAQGASTAAQSAQNTADTALSTAQSAQADASTALTTANQALDAASVAETDAGNALSTANQAIIIANNAQSLATTADANATQAINVSQIANGEFSVNDAVVDANQSFTRTEKSYLTNAASTNFPTDITYPLWFMVYINSNGTSVTHTCWDDTDTSRIYTRTATINNSDPQNPVVTWSPWQSVATPNNLESVDVQVDPSGQPAGTYLVFVYSTTSGTDTLYINLSTLMPVYTPGNGAITISNDYRVALQLDPSASSGLSVGSSGLQMDLQPLFPMSGGFGYDSGSFSVDFSQMPTDKFEALLKELKLPIWLTANTNFYVRPDGNDLNSGLQNTSSGAWKTIQGGLNNLSSYYNIGNYTAILNVANGTYTGKITLPKYSAGTGSIYILGQSTYVLQNGGITASASAGRYSIENMSIYNLGTKDPSSYNEYMVHAMNGSSINLTRVVIYANNPIVDALNTCIFLCSSGSITTGENVAVTINASAKVECMFNINGGLITMGRTFTANGDLGTGYFCRALYSSKFQRGSNAEPFPAINGTITNGIKYIVAENGVIQTKGGGENFFPGATPGTSDHGLYL